MNENATPQHETGPQPAASFDDELAALRAEARADPGPAAPGQPEPDRIPTVEMIKPALTVAFSAFVPHWEIKPAEIDMLSTSYAALVDKYLPDAPIGVELNALFATAIVFGPRIAAPRSKDETAPEASPAAPVYPAGDERNPPEPEPEPIAQPGNKQKPGKPLAVEGDQ